MIQMTCLFFVQLVKRTVNTIPINTLSNTQPKLKTMM